MLAELLLGKDAQGKTGGKETTKSGRGSERMRTMDSITRGWRGVQKAKKQIGIRPVEWESGTWDRDAPPLPSSLGPPVTDPAAFETLPYVKVKPHKLAMQMDWCAKCEGELSPIQVRNLCVLC